jgi:hypothetical protein
MNWFPFKNFMYELVPLGKRY